MGPNRGHSNLITLPPPPSLQAFTVLETEARNGPRKIAQVLPNRVHFAAFAQVRSFSQESRK
jgi:hypothetical protein